MSDKDKTQETGPTTTDLEEAAKVGYLGTVADPTPNEDYQLGGRLAQPPEPSGPDSPEDVKSQLKDEQGSGVAEPEPAKSSKSSRS